MQITKAVQKQQAASRDNRHVADFRELVLERNQELQRLLQGKSNEVLVQTSDQPTKCYANGQITRQKQKASIRQALALSLQYGLVGKARTEFHGMPETSTTILDLHPAATTAAGLLSKSKDLVERYSALCERIGSKEGQRLREQDSEGDVTLLRAVMSKRESHVSRQLHRLISEVKGQSKVASPVPMSPEEEGRTWDKLMEGPGSPRNGVHGAETATWGMAARQAKKGVKRLVKGLPEE